MLSRFIDVLWFEFAPGINRLPHRGRIASPRDRHALWLLSLGQVDRDDQRFRAQAEQLLRQRLTGGLGNEFLDEHPLLKARSTNESLEGRKRLHTLRHPRMLSPLPCLCQSWHFQTESCRLAHEIQRGDLGRPQSGGFGSEHETQGNQSESQWPNDAHGVSAKRQVGQSKH